MFFTIIIIIVFLQIRFLIKNYGGHQNMNIEAHYEFFLLENCPLSSFDIDS
jgi:hypothetical protein